MTTSDVTTATSELGSFAGVLLTRHGASAVPTAAAATAAIDAAAAANGYTADQLNWATPEGIDVKPVYIAADRDAAAAAG